MEAARAAGWRPPSPPPSRGTPPPGPPSSPPGSPIPTSATTGGSGLVDVTMPSPAASELPTPPRKRPEPVSPGKRRPDFVDKSGLTSSPSKAAENEPDSPFSKATDAPGALAAATAALKAAQPRPGLLVRAASNLQHVKEAADEMAHEMADNLHGENQEATSEEAKKLQAEREECRKRWLLHPTQPAKVAWDSVMAVLVIYSVLIVPVRVGFGVEAAKGGAWEFEVLVDFLFLFDVIVNFRSSYQRFDNGPDNGLELRWGTIARRYGFSWCPIDVLSSVPIDLILLIALPDLNDTEVVASTEASGNEETLKLVKLLKGARPLLEPPNHPGP